MRSKKLVALITAMFMFASLFTFALPASVLADVVGNHVVKVDGTYYKIVSDNLFTNADLENGFEGWTNGKGEPTIPGSISIVSDFPKPGAKSIKAGDQGWVSHESNGFRGNLSLLKIIDGLKPNATYYLAFDVFKTNYTHRDGEFTEVVATLMDSSTGYLYAPADVNENGLPYGGYSSGVVEGGTLPSPTQTTKMGTANCAWTHNEFIFNTDSKTDSLFFHLFYLLDFKGYISGFEFYEVEAGDEVQQAGAILDKITIPGYRKDAKLNSNLTLPESVEDYEGEIVWTSSNEDVLNPQNGVFTRPAEATQVVLTASITVGENTYSKDFTYTAEPLDEQGYLKIGDKYYRIVTSNLITNGGFENGYYGWTSGRLGQIAPDYFDIADGFNGKSLYAKVNHGAADPGALANIIPLEKGKIYYFTYYLKNFKNASSGKNGFLKTTVTNNANDEGGAAYTLEGSHDANNVWTKNELLIDTNDSSLNTPYLNIKFRWLNDNTNGYAFDDFCLVELEESEDVTKVAGTIDALREAIEREYLDETLELPEEVDGVSLVWESSDTSVLANDGTFTRPTLDTEVALKVTASYGETEISYVLRYKVLGYLTLAKEALTLEGYTRGMVLTEDIELPTTIEGFDDATVAWASSNEDVLNPQTGEFTQAEKSQVVVLTAIISENGEEVQKQFTFVALGEGTIDADTTNLVAYYTFDAFDENGNVVDVSGQSQHATVINNNAKIEIEDGKAKFPGLVNGAQGAAVKLPNSVLAALPENYTITMWIKQDASYQYNNKSLAFFDFGNGQYSRQYFQLNANKITYQYRPDANRAFDEITIGNQFKGKWNLLTVVGDLTSGSVKYYIDGEEITGATHSGAAWSTVHNFAQFADAQSPYGAYLGRTQWAASNTNVVDNADFCGLMDDVRIYNKALSPEEIAELFAAHVGFEDSKVTINFVDKNGAALQNPVIYNGFIGQEFTPSAVDRIVKDKVVYYPVNNVSAYTKVLAQPEETIDMIFDVKALDAESPSKPIEVIDGNTPIMPKVKVTLETDPEDEVVVRDVEAQWNLEDLKVGENTVTGNALGVEVTATVIVYPCDENVPNLENAASMIHQKLSRNYVGKIYTEYDIIVNKTGDNATSYGPENANDGFGGSATNLQFKNDNNIVSRIGKNDGSATDFNTGVKYQDGVRYRVRTYIDTNGQSNYYATNQTRGNVSQTPDGVVNGNYRIFITPEGGEEFEATLPEVNGRAGNGFRANAQSISKFFAGTNGYGGIVTVTNHKISWLEGYVPVKIQRQFGEGEPEVVETLKNEPGKGFTYEAPESLYKDGIFYVLDKANSTLSYEAGVAGEEEVLTAVYVVDELEEVIPPTIVTRVGIAPELPQYIQGRLKTTGQIANDVEAIWDEIPKELYATPTEEGEEREITGTASYGGKELAFTTKLVVKTVDDYKFVEYKFDGDLLDSSGKGNHGSFYVDRNLTPGTPLYVDGVGSTVSQGIDFGSGFVALPQTAVDEIKNASGLTMTTFVKKYNTGNQFLFTIANNYSTNVTNNSLGYIDSNNFRYETKDGVVHTNMRTSVDSKYVNVAVSVDFVTGNVSIYFDGELVANGTVRTTPQSVAAQMAAIGLSPWPNDQYYKGYVDNFTLYNTVLTDEEIAKLCGKHELTVKYETEDGTAVKDSDVYEDYYGFEFNEDIPSVIAYNNTLYIRTNDAEGVYGVDDEITVIYREVSSVEVHEVLYEPVGYKVPQGKDVPAPDKLFVKATIDNQFEYEAEFPVVWEYDPEEHEPGDVVTIKAYIAGADEPVAEDTVEVYYNFETAYAYFRANGMDVVEGYLVYEGNKFANPSFEENFDGWYNVNASGQIVELPENWIRYDDIAADGTYSIGTTVRNGGQSAGSIIGFAPLNNGQPTKAGQKFLVSYKWYTVEGAMTSTIGLTTNINQTQVDESCGGTGNSGNSPVSSNLAGYPTNTWNTLLYILTANDYTTHAQIYNRWVGPYDRFDDFKCYELVLDANGNPIQISQDDCFAKFEAKVVAFDGTETVIAEGYNKVGVSIKVDVPELEDVVNDLGFVIARAVVNDVIALENVDNPVVVAGYEVVEELQVKLELDEEAKTATLKGINLTDADATVTLIIASYDEDNKLVEVKYQDVTFAAGEEDGNSVTLSLTEDAAVVKAFVWNSIKGLQPVEVIR